VRAPGTQGADIAVAEGQSLGNALNFGGPYVGLFGCRDKLIRQAPGRLAGETVDADGERGFVLTLSTREQHIRRDKATSNICTNSGLCALAFSAHMSLLGEVGLRKLAALNHARAVQTREAILDIDGISPLTETFFNEFAVHLIRSADEVVNKLAQDGIFAGVPARRLYPEREDLDGVLILAATEMTSDHDIKTLADGLKEALA
jgi:glycine dehydrogenase subunit 1